MTSRVAVVGAGISGAVCARVLREHGISAELIERGRAPGGRMASPELHGRRVDLGAAYFTAKEPEFVAAVDGWSASRQSANESPSAKPPNTRRARALAVG